MARVNKIRKQLLNNLIVTILIFLIFSESGSLDLSDPSIYSYVKMKMNEKERIKVYYDNNDGNRFTQPNEVYIDVNPVTNQAYQNFIGTSKNVILIWRNTTITSCKEMFRDCGNVIEMDFSHFNTSQVSNMMSMFRDCKMLKSLNLSNFDTSKVNGNMGGMFWNCISLEYLDISNFETSLATGFGHMFCNCSSLSSLDLSSFSTHNIIMTDYMFYGCSSLISLNLSNFNTSKVKGLHFMFYGCGNLTILDLSSFNTANVKDFNNMFNGCESLTSLDMSNFDTSSIEDDTKFDNIFANCENLEFINFKNYISSSHDLKISNFLGTSKNIVICTSNYKLINEISGDKCITNSCEKKWYNYKTKIYESNKCTDYCTTTKFKYEFKKQCYLNCPPGTIKRENYDNINKYNINYKSFCKHICTKKFPYEMIYEQECVEDCDIKSKLDKICILNYIEKGSENIYKDKIFQIQKILLLMEILTLQK